jgi:hypothetical protein
MGVPVAFCAGIAFLKSVVRETSAAEWFSLKKSRLAQFGRGAVWSSIGMELI